MQLKDYQNTAIKKLLSRSKELLAQSGEKKIIFVLADFLSFIFESAFAIAFATGSAWMTIPGPPA